MDNNEILLKTWEKEKELLLKNIDNNKEEISCWIKKYNELQEQYNYETEKNKKILEEKTNIENQLNSILYSRSYKITQKIKKFLGR